MILRERLTLALNYVSLLEELRAKVSIESLDPILRGAVERYLHLAVESLIDVGMRLCSILRLRRPETYRDVAGILGEAGILDEEDVRKLELWIGFRNILVHGYGHIDLERLLEALQEIEELKRIAGKLASFITEKELDPEEEELGESIEKIRKVLEGRDYIVFAYVFGSRVHGEYTVKGDVDIAIYTKGDITWRELASTLNSLEDEFRTRVDLVHLNTASPALAYAIIATGIVVLDREPEERIDYEVKTIKEYLDLKPRFEQYFKTVIKENS